MFHILHLLYEVTYIVCYIVMQTYLLNKNMSVSTEQDKVISHAG